MALTLNSQRNSNESQVSSREDKQNCESQGLIKFHSTNEISLPKSTNQNLIKTINPTTSAQKIQRIMLTFTMGT